MTALGRVVRSGVRRRWLQSAVLLLTTMVSVTASVLGIGLLLASSAPFERAFSDQHGAHLRMDFDGASVTPQELAATASIDGVSAAAGPFPIATVELRMGENTGSGPGSGPPSGFDFGPMTLSGRADPDGTVDAVSVVAGRWATGPGEVVINLQEDVSVRLGVRLTASTSGGATALTVVGLARSVTNSADGWVTPATVAALTGAGRSPDQQMLYRFTQADTAGQLSADQSRVAATLPPSALTGSQSYLALRELLTANSAAFVPFVIAFGVIAMVMSVLVIGIVVGGAVGAASRRIGILKANGFTPGQVARSYLVQSLIPAVIGVAVGAALAAVLARPVLGEIEQTYGAAELGLPVWVIASVPAAALLLVALAAVLPALRVAGRPAVDVLRQGGRTSPTARGQRVQRALGALPIPRPLSLGLGGPFRRPTRSLSMAATVFCGAVCLTFAVGLMSSLTAVQHSRDPLSGAAVEVGPGAEFAATAEPGGAGGPSAPGGPIPATGDRVLADSAAVAAAITSTPGTRQQFAITEAEVGVSGLTGGTSIVAISGNSLFTAHQMVAGHWLTGSPGEAVLPTHALNAAGASVGDRLTLSLAGRSTVVTVVGEVFDLSHDGMQIYTDASVLPPLGVDSAPQRFLVDLQPGTDLGAYLQALNGSVTGLGADAHAARDGSSSVLVTMNAVAALLTTMLMLVAGIGVLNTVLLETRERVRDLGVFKSLGMTPRQTVAVVLTSVCWTGLVAGALGVPVGVLLHHAIVPMMGGAAGAVLTQGQLSVYGAPVIALLLLGGLLIAALGALAPAGWAARSSSAAALRAE
ncbi:ABC transporter permease [Nakamurella lactea]|uniref:ABC transporter permease n=1 Tax=Nakamurella lactea TaxID=459515 RepID=UPI00041E6160|nr:ABC transporter permease [Nakamurella lactea]